MNIITNGFSIDSGGIYRIINSITGKMYIGSTVKFRIRQYNHKSDLINNCHSSIKLQRSVNKHGISAFSFEILEMLEDRQNLMNLEQVYLDWFKTPTEGYNVSSVAYRPELPPEILAIISSKLRGRKMSDEQRLRQEPIWAARKGVPRPKDVVEKMILTKRQREYPESVEATKRYHREHPEHSIKLKNAGTKRAKNDMVFNEFTLKSLIKDYISMSKPSILALGEKYGVCYSTIAKIFKRSTWGSKFSHYDEILIKIGFEGKSIKDLRLPEVQAKLNLN